MKTYKQFPKIYIGSSDIGRLIIVGYVDNKGLQTNFLNFGGDGEYKAYIVDEETEIGKHYELKYTFNAWIKIYDDTHMTIEITGQEIKIFQAGDFGIIIQVTKNN